MKWGDLFQDPDMVGQTEYLAIHDAIADAVLGTEPDPETELGGPELQHIATMLDCFRQIAGDLKRKAKELNETKESN